MYVSAPLGRKTPGYLRDPTFRVPNGGHTPSSSTRSSAALAGQVLVSAFPGCSFTFLTRVLDKSSTECLYT